MLRNYWNAFEDDPFFNYHSERMRGMDEIFSSYFTSDPLLSLTDGSSAVAQRGTSRSRRGHRAADDWDLYGGSRDLTTRNDPFQSVNALMRSMLGNMSMETMANRIQSDPEANFYTQSAVMSYSNVDGGKPRIYQAMSASRQMPGGLRETRKAVRDSEAGLEKMAIGRHINERGNVITRQRSSRTGDVDEQKDFFNMEEDDLPRFDNEWQEKLQRCYNTRTIEQHRERRDDRNALDNGRDKYRRERLAIEPATRHSKHHRNHRYN